MSSADPDRRLAAGRLAAAEAARQAVTRLARAFEPAGLPVAPLKAALLIHLWGRDPLDRPLSDVDLLVPPGRLDEATRLADEAGWRFVKAERGGRQRLLMPRSGGLPVDLHGALFPEGVFRLDTDAVLRRAALDTATFQAPVRVLDPLDACAHLVGHAALTFLFEHRPHHPTDLAFLGQRHGLSPQVVAERLEMAGLAFAARYVLSDQDAFARQVRAALDERRSADAFAWLVRKAVPLLPVRRGLGLLPPGVLHRSPGRVAATLLDALRRRVGPQAGVPKSTF